MIEVNQMETKKKTNAEIQLERIADALEAIKLQFEVLIREIRVGRVNNGPNRNH